jgi:hypothetical protein
MQRPANAALLCLVVVSTSALLSRAVLAQVGRTPNPGSQVREIYRAKLYGKGQVLFEGDRDSVEAYIKKWDKTHPRDLRLLMLKGPYRLFSADMTKVEQWKGTSVDDGQGRNQGECVSLVRAATGLPNTAKWRWEAKVVGNVALARGTPIATFDKDGRYPTGKNSKHAAIFDHVDHDGTIWVWHQYKQGVRPNEVHLAPLRKDTERYYVIEIPPDL